MPRLSVESGPLRGRAIEVRKDLPCVVGSGEGCDLRLRGGDIQARHFVIKALKGGGFGVKKLEGTFLLNGRPAQAAHLDEGDSLQVGDVKLLFGVATDEAASKLGGFRLFEVLGKGGMGTVYRAEQVSLHREVALKVLNKELTKDPVFVKRFVAEARAAARLQHPNVVHVFDVGHEGDTYYLSMELMAGGSLEERLQVDGFSVNETVQMIADAAEGLSYAENLGIVHRDIKPDNLMLDQHGTVKIADLGLAMTDGSEAVEKIVGTPHFMSPEQVQRKPVDHRSDLYSLGCTFYRLLTGHTPFKRSSVKEILRAHLKDEAEPPNKENPQVPGAISDMVMKLMAKDPAERYQSARELVDELEAAQTPPVRKGLIAAIAAVAVISIGAAAWLFFKDKDTERVVVTRTEKDEKTLAALRESKAETQFLKIRGSSLPPLEKAAQLEAMAKADEYKSTKGAGQALTEAKRIRTDEERKANAQKTLQGRIQTAIQNIDKKVDPLVKSGQLADAAKALLNPDVGDLGKRQEIRDHLQKVRGELQQQATARLDELKGAVNKARENKSPTAILAALPPLEALLDKDKGWPRLLLPDPGDLRLFVRTANKDAKDLQAALNSAAEQAAWTAYKKTGMEVLAKAASFDLASAEALASKLPKNLGQTSAAAPAAQLLALVQAARSYEKAYLEQVAAGKVTAELTGSVNGGGLAGKLQVKQAKLSGDDAAFVLVDADGEPHTLALRSLARPQLDQLLVPLGDKLRTSRLACLLLPVMHGHMQSAAEYLAKLDAKDDASGTGSQSFKANTIRLHDLLRQLGNKPTEPWAAFLRDETRAITTLIDGLRALSDRRNRAAQVFFERILKKYPRSLAARHFDG